jgi:signal transduction histidine kinase
MISGSHTSIKSPKNNMIRAQNNQNTGCLECGNLVTIIKDTGIGIPKANVERLFKIFGNVNRGQQSSLITT